MEIIKLTSNDLLEMYELFNLYVEEGKHLKFLTFEQFKEKLLTNPDFDFDLVFGIKDENKPIYIHCDAGVSRSGGVGYILNEWFNKYLKNNKRDNEFFLNENSHIMPNPEVVRILKNEMFGTPFMNIEVNDYFYNEDGEKIDEISKI